jgi:3-deoxy-D-manno-octulosonic-acid transferase
MVLLYDLLMHLFVLAMQLAAWVNPKARLWVEGRRNWRVQLAEQRTQPKEAHRKQVLWVHVASLGEFEQGRPIIESFRERFPDWKIVLTFFSPSGYEVRKDYAHADLICYLLADTRRNARDFLDLILPDAAIFIKYEFWANYLLELQRRGTPTLLVSALFRPSQPFFKWYGGFWRKMLGCFTHIFVQNRASGQLLQEIGIEQYSVAGDTRVDRVLKIAAAAQPNAVVQAFIEADAAPVLVVGSSWEPDETVIFDACKTGPDPKRPDLLKWKLIIAPHETSEINVKRICKAAGDAIRYSQAAQGPLDSTCLVIDNIGLLNTLYRYGTVAYIGGGFGKSIHNTLEPAAFGLPIIFGPKYEKFEEARQFVARGGAFSVNNAAELALVLAKLRDPVFYQKASKAVIGYLEESRGATEKVMALLEKEFGKR